MQRLSELNRRYARTMFFMKGKPLIFACRKRRRRRRRLRLVAVEGEVVKAANRLHIAIAGIIWIDLANIAWCTATAEYVSS
jgi:transposase InsO family protein